MAASLCFNFSQWIQIHSEVASSFWSQWNFKDGMSKKNKILGQTSTYSKEIIAFCQYKTCVNTMNNSLPKKCQNVTFLCQESTEFIYIFIKNNSLGVNFL
jgi:hypothetical protein